ncbi:hypothetical protein [Halapricum desulfuricans]|uniref:hypothetical protein n=1 Tax=Halapricum desulfuricans TaxID=2841257 RepID=UPI001E5721E0|nr:hypothetical protein [Halapricum desulfuricans]
MNRRSVLVGAGAVAVGVGGWQYRGQLTEFVNQDSEPLETKNPIEEFGGDGFLKQFVLYRSGAARLEFGDDYGCFDRVAVGDTINARESSLKEWQLPRDGELVVDMESAVSKTKDPSNEFWLVSLAEEGSYCFGLSSIDKSFTVPQGWID